MNFLFVLCMYVCIALDTDRLSNLKCFSYVVVNEIPRLSGIFVFMFCSVGIDECESAGTQGSSYDDLCSPVWPNSYLI
jgi:hypothetical protein